MEISPGVELVWSLASHEAMLAKVKNVEPDHFFCAFLKYAESSNTQLGELKIPSIVLFTLIAERDQVKAELNKQKIETELRQQLRALLAKGDYQPQPGEIMHRDESSRQLFVKASDSKRLSGKSDNRIEAVDLLRVMLENPTPNMIAVLGKPTIRAVVPTREESPSLLNRYGRELAGGKTPAPTQKTAPQIQVLAWAIQSVAKTPLLLVCESGVEPSWLVQQATQKQHPAPKLISINLDEIQKDARKEEDFSNQLAFLLGEAGDDANQLFYLDAVKLTNATRALATINDHLARQPSGLIVATEAEAYVVAKDQDASIDNLFRVIWLHNLEQAHLPTRV